MTKQCWRALQRRECRCHLGFVGDSCQYSDLCLATPCRHNGRCANTFGEGAPAYRCDCLPGFMGRQCETVDHCSSSPCLNGGECTNTARVSDRLCMVCVVTIGVARGGPKGTCPPDFLAYLVILCFERRYAKQSIDAHVKKRCCPQYFGLATSLVVTQPARPWTLTKCLQRVVLCSYNPMQELRCR